MSISLEEYQETLKYQNNLKVDVKNISKKYIYTWRPIYEVIHNIFFEETNMFPKHLKMM